MLAVASFLLDGVCTLWFLHYEDRDNYLSASSSSFTERALSSYRDLLLSLACVLTAAPPLLSSSLRVMNFYLLLRAKIVRPASSTVCCQLCHSPFQRSPPLIASRHRRGNRSLSLSRVCRGGLGQGGHAELYALIGSAFVWRTGGGWEGGGQRIGEIMDRRGESLSRPVPLSYNATCFPINGTSGGAAPCRRR